MTAHGEPVTVFPDLIQTDTTEAEGESSGEVRDIVSGGRTVSFKVHASRAPAVGPGLYLDRVRKTNIWRRRWDLNPRWVSPHTISSRADSAALAPLRR